jgi:hypothetical protein
MVSLHERGELKREAEGIGKRQAIWRKAAINGTESGRETRCDGQPAPAEEQIAALIWFMFDYVRFRGDPRLRPVRPMKKGNCA